MAASTVPDAPASPPAPARAALARVALLIALSVSVNILVGAFSGEKLSFLYKDRLGLTAGGVASLGILLGVPNYLRPVFGSVSDLVPLWGYHRRSYMALAGLLVAGGFFGLSALPTGMSRAAALAATAPLVVVAITGLILTMVTADAVMVRVGNATGLVGRLQTVQQFMSPVLSILFAAHLSGYVTQHWSYAACFRTAGLIGLVGLPVSLLIDERRVGSEADSQQARRTALRADRARTLAALRAGARTPGLWAVVLFVFYLIVTPGTNTAQFFYEVDSLRFSKQFLGDLGAWGSAGTILGVLSYAWLSPRLPARALTAGVIALDCLVYVLLAGLHDRTSARVVIAASGLVGIWYTLGLLTLAARACPPGVEAAAYGLVLAAMGLGGTLGEKIGSTLYDHFGTGHRVAHGWHVLLLCGCALSLLATLFVPFLPPWARSRLTLRAQREAAA